MSATRDPSQKHTFVYSNLYQLYQKGKTAAKAADVPAPEAKVAPIAPMVQSSAQSNPQPFQRSSAPAADASGIVAGKIIKAEDMNAVLHGQAPIGLRVTRHEPPSFLGKRLGLNTGAVRPGKVDPTRRQAIDGLRDNLRQLQSLHERLRFMLKEIEELTTE